MIMMASQEDCVIDSSATCSNCKYVSRHAGIIVDASTYKFYQ